MKEVKLCIECNNPGKKNITFDLILCDNCRDLDKYTLITKTDSKKNYYLKDDDIDNLISFTKKTRYGPGTFFIKRDIINVFCNKYYTNIDNYQSVLDTLKNEKNIKKQQRSEKKNNDKEKRKQMLIDGLNNRGISFREDSTLCQKFIDGDKNLNINFVINRMCQMKYLFEYCHMNECKQQAYEEQKEELNAGYFPDISILDQAEYIALKKYSNNKYPEIFPWELNN
jgi:hypothetical protein